MKSLLDTYKKTGTLHHAYVLEGEQEEIRPVLFEFVEKTLKQPVQGNPDFRHNQFETFAIDDARALRDAQANKAIGGGKKLFVIETRFMTVEAQNALLKVFEEPTPDTHFFIITPSREIFLPTLRSRVIVISSEESEERGKKAAREFLSLSVSERLKIAADIAEEKDKGQAIELVNAIIAELYDEKDISSFVLEELLQCRAYLNDRSPSLKLILEHIALIV